MCPLEWAGTATAAPKYRPGGSFRKLGTESYGISGTFCALALLCAKTGTANTITARKDVRYRFMGTSSRQPTWRRAQSNMLYQSTTRLRDVGNADSRGAQQNRGADP